MFAQNNLFKLKQSKIELPYRLPIAAICVSALLLICWALSGGGNSNEKSNYESIKSQSIATENNANASETSTAPSTTNSDKGIHNISPSATFEDNNPSDAEKSVDDSSEEDGYVNEGSTGLSDTGTKSPVEDKYDTNDTEKLNENEEEPLQRTDPDENTEESDKDGDDSSDQGFTKTKQEKEGDYTDEILRNSEASSAPSMPVNAQRSRSQGQSYVRQKGKSSRTGTGAWKLSKGYRYWLDLPLANQLAVFLKDKTVLELGAGTGHYTRIIAEKAKSVVGYDGVPDIEERTNSYVHFADFTERQNFGTYDWVVSLEVGAHIPAEFELTFIDNLHRHNSQGIILSWAVPGQKGYQYNSHSNQYIKGLMASLGYDNDEEVETLFRRAAKLKWFKRSLMVFRKNSAPLQKRRST